MCTTFAASDVQTLKETQLPLSLALPFWFRIRVGDIPAASRKVKKMPGTSAFLRRSCGAKCNRRIPVFTPSRTKVCVFESLIRGRDKILLTRESALENNFSFISFLNESTWFVRFCWGWYFGSSCFVTDLVIKLLLYTETGMLQTAPYQDKWSMTGTVKSLMSFRLFRTPECLFFVSKLYV